MSKEPVVSFVVPVYKKSPAVFEQCLGSLFDQSLKDFEVICVFDGVDQELWDVASSFKKAKLIQIEHGGACKARNAGLDVAVGKYVVFWDADCFIKPDTAARWVDEFNATGCDFVYTGYEFVGNAGGYPSEQFDPYSLQCGNFICSMSPIKREKAPRWDETLTAAQDWDYFLTAVEQGCNPSYVEGSGFVTELPNRESISFTGWGKDRQETIRKVKAKHSTPDRDAVISSSRHFVKALHLAKMVNADILKPSGEDPIKYRLAFNLGYGPDIRFTGIKSDAVKVNYWLPWDVDCLYDVAYKTARETIRLANVEITHHWTCDIATQKRLEDLGIKAEVVPLPSEVDDLESTLPDSFRVLIDADKAYKPILLDIPKAIPHIKVDFLDAMFNQANITEYLLLLSFHESPCVDEGMRRFLLNGRYVVSNVQAPFCGYVDMAVGHKDFKNEIIDKIMDARVQPFNLKAQNYYKSQVDPRKFIEKFDSVRPRQLLEVVS